MRQSKKATKLKRKTVKTVKVVKKVDPFGELERCANTTCDFCRNFFCGASLEEGRDDVCKKGKRDYKNKNYYCFETNEGSLVMSAIPFLFFIEDTKIILYISHFQKALFVKFYGAIAEINYQLWIYFPRISAQIKFNVFMFF